MVIGALCEVGEVRLPDGALPVGGVPPVDGWVWADDVGCPTADADERARLIDSGRPASPDPVDAASAALRGVDRLMCQALRAMAGAGPTGGMPADRLISLTAGATGWDVRFLRRVADTLSAMPAVWSAFDAGRLTWSQVRGIALAAKPADRPAGRGIRSGHQGRADGCSRRCDRGVGPLRPGRAGPLTSQCCRGSSAAAAEATTWTSRTVSCRLIRDRGIRTLTTWPVPNPTVPPEPKPTGDGRAAGDQTTSGDGSVWRWSGVDWERQPWTDPHEVRQVHRVVPALDAAVRACRAAQEAGRATSDALVIAAERDVARAGTTYLQVKTLGARHPSEEYAATRRFYEALGYEALEEFAADALWPGNPCLLMVKHLAAAG